MRLRRTSRASVDANTVAERFNFDWATSDPVDDLDTYWWWARSIRVDPDEVIADDGEGGLWSVPFSTDGTDSIEFGEPVRVAEQYVPVAARRAGDGAAAMDFVRRRGQKVLASSLERPGKPDRQAVAPVPNTTSRGSTMSTSSQRRPSAPTRPQAAAKPTATARPSTPVAGTVQSKAERDALIAAAVADGRLPRDGTVQREAWDRALATDPDARRQLAALRRAPNSAAAVQPATNRSLERALRANGSNAASASAAAARPRPAASDESNLQVRARRLGLPATASEAHVRQAATLVQRGEPIPVELISAASQAPTSSSLERAVRTVPGAAARARGER